MMHVLLGYLCFVDYPLHDSCYLFTHAQLPVLSGYLITHFHHNSFEYGKAVTSYPVALAYVDDACFVRLFIFCRLSFTLIHAI